MLCRRCRRQLARRSPACLTCGAPARPGAAVYELVLPSGERTRLTAAVTIGRGRHNAVRLADPAVSRNHAWIVPSPEGPVLEDRGSTQGTMLDGRPVRRARLADGSRVRVGATELTVTRVRADAEPGRTIFITAPPDATTGVAHPRLRDGWALKRVGGGEGHVLKERTGGALLRLTDDDAALLTLIDGRRTLSQLVAEAERVQGAAGPQRLLALVAELADRGVLNSVDGARPRARATGRLAAMLRPRERCWRGAGSAIDRLYRAGGWLLFTRVAWALLAGVAIAGLAAFAALVATGARTPFVVAGDVPVGSAIFLAGRLLVATSHELAHGLAMASFGRRVGRAGGKVVLVFPYLFVDTTDAWLEPQRRRIAIALAGPANDLLAVATMGLIAATAHGVAADIAYQLAFGAFIGALFNLNPLLERDGYHVLADVLREPKLRARASARLAAVLAGRAPGPGPRWLGLYGAAVLAWSTLTAGFAVTTALRARPALSEHLPEPAVWLLLGTLFAGLLAAPLLTLGSGLAARRRRPLPQGAAA